MLSEWIKLLEEAIKCDPDYGDPNICLQEIEGIILKMKKRDFNTFKFRGTK